MRDFPSLARSCSDFRRSLSRASAGENVSLSRRGLLQLGALGATGLSLSELLASESLAKQGAGQKNVILLWMRGGPSHIDMWDPKPEAPAEFRGEFGTMPTNVSGIQLTDMLPQSARVMDKWSIVRSLHHEDAGHSTGDQICFTGYGPGRNPDENVHPSIGSVVSEQLGRLSPELPSYVMVPRQVPGTGSGYLGVAHQPFETGADPASTGPFKVQNFQLADGLSINRLDDRKQLLAGLDRLKSTVDASGRMEGLNSFSQRAWEMIASPAAQKAFDLDSEPDAVRQRYGFSPAFDPGASDRCGAPAWSQRILLARRLVEAGVRLVTVDLRWWDTHVQGFDSLRRGFLPRFDQAYSALIEDLHDRGLLESTLVVAWGEFGRTPRVNKDAGRDHYPNVFSAALAGGKVKGGRVLGSSDSKGAFPKDNPKSPQDVLATMYDHLGVDISKHYLNSTGRPIRTLPHGEPLKELFV